MDHHPVISFLYPLIHHPVTQLPTLLENPYVIHLMQSFLRFPVILHITLIDHPLVIHLDHLPIIPHIIVRDFHPDILLIHIIVTKLIDHSLIDHLELLLILTLAHPIH